jgi:hypothetical protein
MDIKRYDTPLKLFAAYCFAFGIPLCLIPSTLIPMFGNWNGKNLSRPITEFEVFSGRIVGVFTTISGFLTYHILISKDSINIKRSVCIGLAVAFSVLGLLNGMSYFTRPLGGDGLIFIPKTLMLVFIAVKAFSAILSAPPTTSLVKTQQTTRQQLTSSVS